MPQVLIHADRKAEAHRESRNAIVRARPQSCWLRTTISSSGEELQQQREDDGTGEAGDEDGAAQRRAQDDFSAARLLGLIGRRLARRRGRRLRGSFANGHGCGTTATTVRTFRLGWRSISVAGAR